MLREATDADQDAILRWRNHPKVRAMSFTTHVIPPHEHAQWWEGVKEDPDRHVMIFEGTGGPAGVVTYTMEEAGSAVWGFYLDVDGLQSRGELVPAWLEIFDAGIDYAFAKLGVRRLHGELFASNSAVRELHRRYGFSETHAYDREVDGETREVIHLELRSADRQQRSRRAKG